MRHSPELPALRAANRRLRAAARRHHYLRAAHAANALELAAAIRAARAAGMTPTEITREAAVSRATVYTALSSEPPEPQPAPTAGDGNGGGS